MPIRPLLPPVPLALALILLAGSGTSAQESIYRHATGLAFVHPADWQVQETELGVAVLPADARYDATGQPLELILVNAEQTPDIATPDDPRIIQFFEQQAAPLRRIGAVEALRSGLGPGALLTFEGSDGFQQVEQRVYVTVLDGTSVFVVHAAGDGRLDDREPEVRRLFASLEWDRSHATAAPGGSPPSGRGGAATGEVGAATGEVAAELDPDLVRAWHRSSTSGSTGGGGSVYATDRETVVFGRDGSLVYAVGTTVSADVPDLSAYGRGDPNVRHGQWSIEGGMLMIRWEAGGVDRFAYNVFIHTDGLPALKIQPNGGEAIFFR